MDCDAVLKDWFRRVGVRAVPVVSYALTPAGPEFRVDIVTNAGQGGLAPRWRHETTVLPYLDGKLIVVGFDREALSTRQGAELVAMSGCGGLEAMIREWRASVLAQIAAHPLKEFVFPGGVASMEDRGLCVENGDDAGGPRA
jgi:hypothetical protein